MSDPEEKKYKQLALFSVIVAEVVITPCALGGLTYWLMKGKELQMPLTAAGALLGLCVAMYRVYQIYKIQNKDE